MIAHSGRRPDSDDPFGGLALVANETRELVELHGCRLDASVDEHALPEVAVLDDAVTSAASLAKIGFGVPAGANNPNQVEG